MPSLAADELQVKVAFRKQRVDTYQRNAARQLKSAATVLTRGSDYLLRVGNASRTVLVWTDTIQYPRLILTDASERSPGFNTFKQGMMLAGYNTICAEMYGRLTPADLGLAHQLRQQYPKGAFFFPKTDEAHKALLDAIAAAEAEADANDRASSEQPVAQERRTKAKKDRGRKKKRQEESEADSESSELLDTGESDTAEDSEDVEQSEGGSENDEADSGVDAFGGDSEIEEEEEDQEEVEETDNEREVPIVGQVSKRRRQATASEEGADEDEPLSPPSKPIRKKKKSSRNNPGIEHAVNVVISEYFDGKRARSAAEEDRQLEALLKTVKKLIAHR